MVGPTAEVKYQVSQEETSQWIQLAFNFSNVTETNFNRVVLYFDGGNSIPSGAGHKYYFDDIEKSAALLPPTCTDGIQNGDETDIDCGGTTCNPCPAKLTEFNFNFDAPTPLEGAEEGVFNDDATNTITDGINPTTNVGEISQVNGSWYSQLKYQFNDGVDLSSGDKGFSIKVIGPRVIPVTIKVEDGGDNADVTVDYTTPNVWQELKFDFSSFTSTNNKKIALFFDIATNFDSGVDPALNIFQIDDYVFGKFSTLSIKDFEIEGLGAYPNPTNSTWTISTKNQLIEKIAIYNVLGKNVLSLTPKAMTATINASHLAPGIYISTITTEKGTASKKLIKQ